MFDNNIFDDNMFDNKSEFVRPECQRKTYSKFNPTIAI